MVALLLCGRLSATDYCYSITHGFDTGETTTSLLVPVTNFPEGHAALSQPCGKVTPTLGKPLPNFFGLKCKIPLSFVVIQANMTYFNHC